MNHEAYQQGYQDFLKEARQYSLGERLYNTAWELPAGGLLGSLGGVGLGALGGMAGGLSPEQTAALMALGGGVGAAGGTYLGLQHHGEKTKRRMQEMGLNPDNPNDVHQFLGV